MRLSLLLYNRKQLSQYRHLYFPTPCHLQAALRQAGPWQGTDPVVDAAWLDAALTEAVNAINWRQAANDVEPFLSAAERHGLALWKAPFFLDKVRKLGALLSTPATRN